MSKPVRNPHQRKHQNSERVSGTTLKLLKWLNWLRRRTGTLGKNQYRKPNRTLSY